jgi:hypothetical protein
MTQLLDFHTEFIHNCRNICATFGTTNLLYSEELVPLLLTVSSARLHANICIHKPINICLPMYVRMSFCVYVCMYG